MAAAIMALRRKARRKRAAARDTELADAPAESPKASTSSGASSNSCAYVDVLPCQAAVRDFYSHPASQLVIAVVICANFVANCVEMELDPSSMFGEDVGRGTKPLHNPALWQMLEDVFNIVFLVELVVNWYGLFFLRFWMSGWNLFDFVVVANGCLNLARVDLGPLSLLRMLRAFRVFRLFKRIKSLRKIVTALFAAIPGVGNAFFIMVIIASIYAILAVEFFSTFGVDGHYNTSGGQVDAMTLRALPYGDEYFGTFSRSLYTMFQVGRARRARRAPPPGSPTRAFCAFGEAWRLITTPRLY